MHYLIDGYNFLFNTPDTHTNLQTQREQVLDTLLSIFDQLKMDITVVFDGKGSDLNIHQLRFLNIVYTPSALTADEYILEKLMVANNPTLFTVVTSDVQLGKICKQYRAKVMSVRSFLKWIEKKKKKQSHRPVFDFKDSKANIDRLLKIFEDKLNDD